LLVGLACVLQLSCAQSVGQENLPRPTSDGHQLVFGSGIGFYWAADGITHFLSWTHNARRPANQVVILDIPPDARFFSYGLDFSNAPPPHLRGYVLTIRLADGTTRGGFPTYFHPVPGYDQPVYEIVLQAQAYMTGLGFPNYEYFAFEIPSGLESPAYLFHYATDEYLAARDRAREQLITILSNAERDFTGTLRARTLVFDADTHDFTIRFTRFNPETMELQAQARGDTESTTINFRGEMIGTQRVVLRQIDGDVVWDLRAIIDDTSGDLRTLLSEYSRGLSRFQVVIQIGAEQ
jgi:hypothetical protein